MGGGETGAGRRRRPGGRRWPGRPGRQSRRHWRPVLAWTLVGSWGAWAAVRLTGADRLPGFGVPAVPLLAVTPYVTAAAPVPVIAALLLRRPRAAIVACAITGGLALAVLPRALGGGQPAAHGPELRVMTANLYFGEADPNRLAELVRRFSIDVLSLQELPPEAVRRYEAAGLLKLLPHKVLDVRWGAAGSGLYSRYPMRALPQIAGASMAMPAAEISLPDGGTVEVTAVHPVPPISSEASREWRDDLAALPPARSDSVALAGRSTARHPARHPAEQSAREPVRILAGDFNATLDHARLRRLIGRGYADAADRAGVGLVPTWGLTRKIPLTIDHVLVDGRAAVRHVSVHDLRGSDHRAVYARLRLPG